MTLKREDGIITVDTIRNIANGIWWSNAWKVSGILGVITIFTIPVSLYAYSQDRSGLESKVDMLIKYIKEDVAEIKISLADQKKIIQRNEMEIKHINTTLGVK